MPTTKSEELTPCAVFYYNDKYHLIVFDSAADAYKVIPGVDAADEE